MSEPTKQQHLLCPAEELALAKQLPNGCALSPAAQALYEEEGRQRFAMFHRLRPAKVAPPHESLTR